MSTGKYSPNLPNRDKGFEFFRFNCYGQEPAEWSLELKETGIEYDEKTMFGDYDSEGYDRYGYSCFDLDGNYIGLGQGVDRNGNTEMDYLIREVDYE
jgi:hypothetical protein